MNAYTDLFLSVRAFRVLVFIATAVITELDGNTDPEFVFAVGTLDDLGLVIWDGNLVGVTLKGLDVIEAT
ncbi:MAG TPA: hypothetical protein VGH54_23530, partial [Mycobacterium sp.]|uniref:hypothetical protein n=1 Tax=Mycobacterium sp. TaxID=1785 RepID=UPI002F4162CE